MIRGNYMYREILENYAKENKWVKIQPPAQMQDIKKAEEYVGHPFPDDLVKLLLELNGDKWLILSTEEIIETAFTPKKKPIDRIFHYQSFNYLC